jgi:nucleotide-binding universal stress UspA family protein
MGAIATGGVRVLNNDVIMAAGITKTTLEEATELQRIELDRRERLYRRGRPAPDLRGRTVILVDDGIATGATVRAAIAVVRAQKPARLVLAVPVAQESVATELAQEVDELVCVLRPGDLFGIGAWYEHFSQLTDPDVQTILARAAAEPATLPDGPGRAPDLDGEVDKSDTPSEARGTMFRKLLIPLDRSALAEQAIGQAAAIARASQAEIDLVLVHQPMPLGGFDDAPWNTELGNEERAYLASVSAEVASGSSVPVTAAVLRGEPVDMICQRIGAMHADVVVMTSHGRTGLSRAWLGSVADGVLRRSAVPVLMLRPIEGKSRRDAAHRLFKRVLVPVDGSALATEVFAAATSLAKCSGARVWLLRVVQPIPLPSTDAAAPYAQMPPALVDETSTKVIAGEAGEQLNEIARRLHDESGVEIEAQVVIEPRVAPAILDFARTHDVDVIAMSTHGRGASRLLLGSVADKVLRGGGLPMLLYRPLDIQVRERAVERSAEVSAAALTHT